MNALKKSVLLLALAAASVGAHAADVYGNVDVAMHKTTIDGSTLKGLDSNGMSDSFIGFKHIEDIDGLKIGMTLEAGYNLDTGATADNLFNRETSLSISSGMHTVKIGRLPSLGYAEIKAFDAFRGGNLGAARSNSTVAEFNDNTIGYSFAHYGLRGAVQHSLGEQVDAGFRDGATTAVSIGYDRGPVSASVVRTDVDNGQVTTQVAGAVDFGSAQASVIVQDAKNSLLDRSVTVGMKAPMGRYVALASVGQVKLVSGETIDQFSIGGEYRMSKRTAMYASFGKAEVVDSKGEQLAIGLTHAF